MFRAINCLVFMLFSTAIAETLNDNENEWAKKKKFWLGSIHGVLMVVAWLLLVPKATLAARYLRNHSSRNSVFKLPNWFQLHRTSNYAAVILSLISIVLILIAQGFRWTGPWFGSGKEFFQPGVLHSLLGGISILLACIQPVMAYFRPKPSSPTRFRFNLLHKSVGIAAIVFAIGAMSLVANKFAKRFHSPGLIWNLWLLYIVLAVVTVIALEFLFRKTQSPMRIGSDMELDDQKKQSYDSTEEEEKRKQWMWMSSLIFVLFSAMSFGVTTIFLVNMILKF